MKRMLISKHNSKSLIMGISDGGSFTELNTSDNQLLNIYYGLVKSVEEDHVAVDYGANRLGLLPIENVSKNYFNEVDHKLEVGQNIIVQIFNELEQVLLSTFISLTGSSLKLLPKNLNTIDKKSLKSLDFNDYKKHEKEYKINPDFSIIILKDHENKTREELEWDLNVLIHHWQAIKDASLTREPTFLIYKEHNPLISPIKNAISEGVTEIFIDQQDLFEEVKSYLEFTNSKVGVFYYDLPDNLINRQRWISWETIKDNQKTANKNSIWSKIVNLFSKEVLS